MGQIVQRENIFFEPIHQRRRKLVFDVHFIRPQLAFFLENKTVKIVRNRHRFFEILESNVAVLLVVGFRKSLIEQIVKCPVNYIQVIQQQSVSFGRKVLDFLQVLVRVFVRGSIVNK